MMGWAEDDDGLMVVWADENDGKMMGWADDAAGVRVGPVGAQLFLECKLEVGSRAIEG